MNNRDSWTYSSKEQIACCTYMKNTITVANIQVLKIAFFFIFQKLV